MFSRSNSRVTTAACVVAMVVMMMMMMKTEAAAMTKRHRRAGDGAAVETVPLQLDPKALVVTTNFRALQNSSISPWTYNTTHHESLYPPTISEAHCLLRGCLNSEGKEDLNLESKPIKRQVLVLRRVRVVEVGSGAGSGTEYSYHFRLEYRVVTVGCTCVRPSIQSP